MSRRERDEPRELTAEQAQQVEAHLREASGRLPEGTDLSRFEEILEAGDLQMGWEELRELAEERPTPFGFWVEMSKAGDLLGRR